MIGSCVSWFSCWLALRRGTTTIFSISGFSLRFRFRLLWLFYKVCDTRVLFQVIILPTEYFPCNTNSNCTWGDISTVFQYERWQIIFNLSLITVSFYFTDTSAWSIRWETEQLSTAVNTKSNMLLNKNPQRLRLRPFLKVLKHVCGFQNIV